MLHAMKMLMPVGPTISCKVRGHCLDGKSFEASWSCDGEMTGWLGRYEAEWEGQSYLAPAFKHRQRERRSRLTKIGDGKENARLSSWCSWERVCDERSKTILFRMRRRRSFAGVAA